MVDWKAIGMAVKEAGPSRAQRQQNADFYKRFEAQKRAEWGDKYYKSPEYYRALQESGRLGDQAVIDYMTNWDNWKRALRAGLTASDRTVAKVPSVAYGAVSYPTSWLLHGIHELYNGMGLSPSQEDYENTKAAIGKLNAPVNWWNSRVDKYLPYPKELMEDAPAFKPTMDVVEDIGAGMVPGATRNLFQKIKDLKAFNPNWFRLRSKGSEIPRPVTRFTDPMKDPAVQKAFRSNGLNPSDYRFNNRYVRNTPESGYGDILGENYKKGTIHDPQSYRPGINVRSNGDGPRGNLVEADAASRRMIDRSYATEGRPLWVAPRESSYVGAPIMTRPESSLSTLDNRFLVKWKNGSPVYVPDRQIKGEPFLQKLRERGADIRQFLSRNGYHTGKPRVMRAYADSIGWSPSKLPPGTSHLDTLSEGVRIVPPGTANPTADIIDFAPNFGFNGHYKLRPLFTRRGYESAFTPEAIVNLPTKTMPTIPPMGSVDAVVRQATGNTDRR